MTRRTIFRDLRALQAAGVPVVFDEARRCYQLKGAFMTPPAQLTEAEMLALVCVAGKLAATLQTPLLKEVQRALAKFRGQYFKLGYSRKACRQINHYVRDRLTRHPKTSKPASLAQNAGQLGCATAAFGA